jgi:Carboxypeptidase regulatory-like domain
MLNRSALLGVCSFILLVSGPLLFGQANASFSGTVTDKAGAVIAGATVTATSQETGVVREAKTDDSGHYLIPLLPVSFYKIHIEAQGFGPAEQRDIRLQVDEHREVNFSMQPAAVTTAVEVNATEVAVETANPTLGQVITSEQVADLPLNGRNFTQLATLTPGTTTSTSPVSFFTSAASSEAATRGSFSLSSGGSREQETDWLLDGNDNNQLDEGGIAIFSSIDDIQEFKVLTYNYSAEYGERAGPTVLVTTKSGSNQFHGSVFEFFRNTDLDATRFFFTSKQQFNLNQFGGSIGGPIKKDKTFFFLDYQAKMQRQGVPFTGFVPTTGMSTPDANGNYDFSQDPLGITPTNPFAGGTPFQCVPNTSTPEPVNPANGTQTAGQACAIIPAALINPIGAAVAQLYPAPTAGLPSNAGFNYENQPVRRLNEGTWDVRIDHTINSKDSLYARFSYDQATNYVPGGSPTWAVANAFGSNQHIENHGRNAVLTETHLFSPNLVNQFTAGYSRIFNHILSFGTGSCEAAILGIPGADLASQCDNITGYPASLNQASQECVSCGLTSFDMSAYFSVGDRGYAPYQGGTNVYSLSDTLDVIRGKHDVKVGLTFRANEMNIRNNAFQDGFAVETGVQTGDDISDLLLGGLGVFAAHDQTFLGATTGRRWKLFRPFVQDDWRITNSLTLNLGFAWALATPVVEEANRQADFNVQNLMWYVPKGSPGIAGCSNCIATDGRAGIQFDKTALEPRIGFAWKPKGSEKTVIRGGYGIIHDSAWNQGGQGLWQNPPFYAEVDPCTFCFAYGSAFGSLSDGFLLPVGTPSSIVVNGGAGAVYNAPVNPQSYTGSIQSQNLNFKQGIIQQFNLNVERQLPGNIVLTVGYGGSRSAHVLVGQLNENIESPSICMPTVTNDSGATAVNPYFGTNTVGCGINNWPYAAPFQSVDTNNSVGAARYDSLQVKAETKSVRHGIYALIGYTYSRNFDSGLTDGLGTNPGAMYYPLPGYNKLDWGLSQLNLNNSFTASVLYDLPFGKGKPYGSTWSGATNAVLGGWQVNLIERATSGFPLFVVDSADESGVFFSYNGNTFQRPNEVGDPNKAGDEGGQTGCPTKIHTLQNWFNPCAFQQAPVYTFTATPIGGGAPQQFSVGALGTAPRAPVYGPRFVNTDFSIFKDFPLGFREGMSLQFRAEFFNLFNHTQFYLNGYADTGEQDINTASSFGVVNNTVNNPRLIQFALKLKF